LVIINTKYLLEIITINCEQDHLHSPTPETCDLNNAQPLTYLLFVCCHATKHFVAS